jgi:hypothetical protein
MEESKFELPDEAWRKLPERIAHPAAAAARKHRAVVPVTQPIWVLAEESEHESTAAGTLLAIGWDEAGHAEFLVLDRRRSILMRGGPQLVWVDAESIVRMREEHVERFPYGDR